MVHIKGGVGSQHMDALEVGSMLSTRLKEQSAVWRQNSAVVQHSFAIFLDIYVYTYVPKIDSDDKPPETLEIVLGIKSYTSYPV